MFYLITFNNDLQCFAWLRSKRSTKLNMISFTNDPRYFTCSDSTMSHNVLLGHVH